MIPMQKTTRARPPPRGRNNRSDTVLAPEDGAMLFRRPTRPVPSPRTADHRMAGTRRLPRSHGPVLPGALLLLPLALFAMVQRGEAASRNSTLDISHDGRWLAVANRDAGSTTVIDLADGRTLREIPLGLHPEGVCFIGRTSRFAVAVHGADYVAVCDAATGRIEQKIPVFDEPYGVIDSPDGATLYVTLEYPGRVAEIDVSTGRVRRELPAGRFPRGIARAPDGNRVYVSEYYTATVHAVDPVRGTIIRSWSGASTDNLARQLTHHPRRNKLYLPHIRSRVTAVHGTGSIFPYVTVISPDAVETPRRRIPMDAFRGNLVTANPWETAISPDGRWLAVVFSGTDDMFLCRVLDDDYRELEDAGYRRLGHNPRAAVFSPDGRRLYVLNALDFEVIGLSVPKLEEEVRWKVCRNPLPPDVHRGKILFYSARPPMSTRRWIACSSCHPDGDADGRTWHNPEGLRNTPPLFGLAWTHPLHWSADRDEVQDFEHTIRSPLMLGLGLIRGQPAPALGPPNRGRSRDLDALAAYTTSHTFTLSPHARDGLSEAARRGRELFFRADVGCAECHRGPFYTDSTLRRPFAKHDVGTGKDDPTEKMGPAYDTPTLLGVYRSAPYLHHGKAATLLDVLTTFNKGDRHGRTSHLSQSQLQDLVEFLKSLPYEDPVAAARRAGLKPVPDAPPSVISSARAPADVTIESTGVRARSRGP
ncbi:MAG: hypothetical protein D6725_02110 [Planctomycetota bacterium]|nr:MAG: hypothetical protein D6725_02110 [Planctomycetota bacterium]